MGAACANPASLLPGQVAEVAVSGPRYWAQSVRGPEALAALYAGGVLHVQRKSGALAYAHDPTGVRSLLSHAFDTVGGPFTPHAASKIICSLLSMPAAALDESGGARWSLPLTPIVSMRTILAFCVTSPAEGVAWAVGAAYHRKCLQHLPWV